MICDLNCVYFGDGIYAFMAKVKGNIVRTILEASCLSEAYKKADLNLKISLKKCGFNFERNELQWYKKLKNFSDIPDQSFDNKERLWYVEEDEHGKIIPKKLNTNLMTEDECKKYILSLLFK